MGSPSSLSPEAPAVSQSVLHQSSLRSGYKLKGKKTSQLVRVEITQGHIYGHIFSDYETNRTCKECNRDFPKGPHSLVAQMVKSLPAMQETWVRSVDQEDPLEYGMAIHSSILSRRIPWQATVHRGGKESDRTETI